MQAITRDSVVLKFEKARCALQDSLRWVKDIVPQPIGGQYQFFILVEHYLRPINETSS
ncbi:U-box domain-containing protein 45, partial [Sarracenia purpurea var. burkii]